jgi:hypothetical protein
MIMFRRICNTLAICCFTMCFVLGGRATAQVTTADMVGTVTDSSGAIVPNAKVTIDNLGTHEVHSAQTAGSGDFTFNFLQPGTYSVTVEATGFQTFKISALTIGAGDRARADAKLQVGQETQTVQVTAAASALQTDSATVGSVVSNRTVQDVPLDGRNYVALVQNTMGINNGPPNQGSSGTRPDDRRQTNEVSANGQPDDVNNNMVDGMDNNERNKGLIMIRPSIEAIQDVRVDTSVASAENGRSGGAVINVITRAGTNAFHGSLYEFLRNDKLDANDYFANQAGVPRAEYRQNQFGGSVGGPIRKNKDFFFADAEELRIVQGMPTGLITVPTLYEEQHPGDLSDQGGPVIPASQLDPVALNYWALFPAPNVPTTGVVNNYSASPLRTQNATTVDARVDHHFSNGDSMFGRYSWNPVSTFTPGFLPEKNGVQPGGGSFPGPNATTGQGTQVHYIHTFAPNLVMELGMGYSRINLKSLPLNYGNNVGQSFGLPNSNISQNTSGLAPISVTAFTSSASGQETYGDSEYLPLLDVNNVFQWNGAVTYTRGSHNIKMGAGLIRRQMQYNQYDFGQGLFSFSGTPLASEINFLQGNATTLQRSMPEWNFFGLRWWEPDVFIQDDWRATNWLTLNLGFRWDYFSPESEAHNHRSNFDLATLSMIVATPSDPTAGVKGYYKNFAPRIGFAASRHNTVLRGGFGLIYYSMEQVWAITLINQPNFYSFTCQPASTTSGLTCPAGIGKLSGGVPLPQFGSINPLSGEVYEKTPNYPTSYMEQANLALQRQFGQTTVTAAWVGNFGRRVSAALFPNLPAPQPGPTPNYRYAAQLPGVNIIYQIPAAGSSNYNAGQFMVERRYSNGLVINGNYTLAHGLDNTSQNGSPEVGELYGNMRYDYGNSDFDIRNRFNLLANYTLPFFANATGIKRQLLAGWSINSLAYWESGLPFMVYDTAYPTALINLPGITSDRPNRVPGQSYKLANHSVHEWFNTQAFEQQPQGTPGNAGRNQVYAPPTRELDASILKDFPIRESLRLQFRAEAFNVTNTENFGAPAANIGGWNAATNTPTNAGGLGQITSTILGVNPRVFQFALKVTY